VANKEHPDSICDDIIEIQRTGRYDVTYLKTKELGWKESQGIKNIDIEDPNGIYYTQVLEIWDNYITGSKIDLIDQKD
jgi:hypothetical protein